jgi:deoxycytidylate deaminase
MNFDWASLAFGNKKPVRSLRAIFIAAPRELSAKRFTQLVKAYLPQGNIVLGLAKEPYVTGLEEQPQFKMLRMNAVQAIIDKVNTSGSKHKIYTLKYFQRELPYILEKLTFSQVLLINGSWHHAFHNLPAFYALVSQDTPYNMLSPFADEPEAKVYESRIMKQIAPPTATGIVSEAHMMSLAGQAAKGSFDYNLQSGGTLGKKTGKGYKFLASSYNRVVPFQTYAMHYGASREKNFSPPHDLNHYDTIHFEVQMLITAQKMKLGLTGTTLFASLMPCPACARMISQTDIAELVYGLDHSDGYAINMLEKAGKVVRRVTPS